MTQISKDSPPPAYPGFAESEAFMDLLMENEARQRTPKEPSPEIARSVEKEAARIKNFIAYVLAIDYQCNPNTALSWSDRAHFLALVSTINDIYDTYVSCPDQYERKELAPYFWHYVHEPCRVLKVPVDSFVLIINRFRQFVNFGSFYKGCFYGVLHSEGLETLAEKLYTDRNIMIPAVFDNLESRHDMFVSLGQFQDKYFKRITGLEGSTHISNNCRMWMCTESVQYELNDRGWSYDQERLLTISNPARRLSPAYWISRARDCTARFLERCKYINLGRLHPDPPNLSWHGNPCVMPEDTPETDSLHPYPPGWQDFSRPRVPDLFEYRPRWDQCS